MPILLLGLLPAEHSAANQCWATQSQGNVPAGPFPTGVGNKQALKRKSSPICPESARKLKYVKNDSLLGRPPLRLRTL
jgi:hypothetical protein